MGKIRLREEEERNRKRDAAEGEGAAKMASASSGPSAVGFSSAESGVPPDCSHDIKRCLLLGRKFMTNLDSILKSRDVTLPTKVHLVKAMVFPVVMYGCESWTVKKAER